MAELHVIGQIRGASGFPDPSLFCKWQFVHGGGWRVLEGQVQGQTQVDTPAGSDATVFGHPLDIHYATQGMQGWPKLQVEVWHQDDLGRNDLYGYGFAPIPMTPGTHDLVCHCWRPAGSALESLRGRLVGGGYQLGKTDIVHTQADRFKLKTETMGCVQIRVSLLMRHFQKYGIEM
ncbi:uncharacterized protein MONBRDRAFT_17074 [Monosiga brevicollis MX1]|uniref:B9 domain-containing protein 2 n=1 Tax=Monosiga brevicollis TaxID=81824 RepID=A9UPA9_MONBE|nr:uncharacterized protein MONBRDRAFT_17074 [Monosiga brevicollis MX1]EDQ92386.1 predicted protein [Monosiga brevicollis MX1]|eukprot:XP_001742148.1 hypothetical protein [Monosiga brevicollis MX1]